MGVPTNNQRGQSSDLVTSVEVRTMPVMHALLVREQCLKKNLFMTVEVPNTRPNIVFSMISGVDGVLLFLFPRR